MSDSQRYDQWSLEIILAFYQVQTKNLQEVRQSVERLTVGSPGLTLIAAGWVATREVALTEGSRIALVMAVLLFSLTTNWIVWMLNDRYLGYASVVRTINDYMRVREVGAFLPGRTIAPDSWGDFGTHRFQEPVFSAAHVIVLLTALVAIAVILST